MNTLEEALRAYRKQRADETLTSNMNNLLDDIRSKGNSRQLLEHGIAEVTKYMPVLHASKPYLAAMMWTMFYFGVIVGIDLERHDT